MKPLRDKYIWFIEKAAITLSVLLGVFGLILIISPVSFVANKLNALTDIISVMHAILFFFLVYGQIIMIAGCWGLGIALNKSFYSLRSQCCFQMVLVFVIFLPLLIMGTKLNNFAKMDIERFEILCKIDSMIMEEGQRVKMTSLEREIVTFAKHFD